MRREDDRAARLAAAQRALAAAETNAGLRQRLVGATARASAGSTADVSGAVGSARTAAPRPAVEDLPTEGAVALAGNAAGASDPAERTIPAELLLPLPPALDGLLPWPGVRRGSALQVRGSTSLLLAMAAAATAEEDTWCAVVAMPDVGLAAAAEAGLDLSRTLVVPRPGPDAPSVLGALIDGVDVLVLGPCPALGEADLRRAASRLRTRESVLLTTERWPGAQAVLEVGERSFVGVGAGDGVLTGREATVTVLARGFGVPRSARVRMLAGGVLTVAGPVAGAAPVAGSSDRANKVAGAIERAVASSAVPEASVTPRPASDLEPGLDLEAALDLELDWARAG